MGEEENGERVEGATRTHAARPGSGRAEAAPEVGEAGGASTDPRRGAASSHRHLPATRATARAAAKERQGIGTEQYKLLFAVRRSVRYHMQRQRFFDRVGTIAVAVSLAFASGTVLVRVSLAVDSKWVLIVASVSALAQALLLTLQQGQKARKHNDLARDFIALEKQVTRRQNQISQDRLDAFTSKRLTIESREPPVARILDAMCHNEMLRAYGRENEQRPVSWFQRLTANLRSEYQRTPAALEGPEGVALPPTARAE